MTNRVWQNYTDISSFRIKILILYLLCTYGFGADGNRGGIDLADGFTA